MIPVSLRPEMKRRLHAAHMGYVSMMARARETIFWPRMSSEVKQVAAVPDLGLWRPLGNNIIENTSTPWPNKM